MVYELNSGISAVDNHTLTDSSVSLAAGRQALAVMEKQKTSRSGRKVWAPGSLEEKNARQNTGCSCLPFRQGIVSLFSIQEQKGEQEGDSYFITEVK